jgi:hypothetical protein
VLASLIEFTLREVSQTLMGPLKWVKVSFFTFIWKQIQRYFDLLKGVFLLLSLQPKDIVLDVGCTCLHPIWGQFHQHVYSKFLCTKIPKAQKDTQVISVFFALFWSASVKAACKMLVKLTPLMYFFHKMKGMSNQSW